MIRLLYNKIFLTLYKVRYLGYFVLVFHIVISTYNVYSKNIENSHNRIISFFKKIAMLFYVVSLSYKCSSSNRNHKYIFMMYEPRFRKIFDKLNNDKVIVLMLDRGIFDYLFHEHLERYLIEAKRGFGEYALTIYERYSDDRNQYLIACQELAMKLKKVFSHSSIILPKYNDDYTLELIQAFSNSSWRVIVYDREGTVTKKRLETIPEIVARQRVECETILTYNQTHCKFFQKVFFSTSGDSPSIKIMGNPVSDEWYFNNLLIQTSKNYSTYHKL